MLTRSTAAPGETHRLGVVKNSTIPSVCVYPKRLELLTGKLRFKNLWLVVALSEKTG